MVVKFDRRRSTVATSDHPGPSVETFDPGRSTVGQPERRPGGRTPVALRMPADEEPHAGPAIIAAPMRELAEPSRRRPTTRRTREVKAGPRTRLTEWWVLLDVPLIGAAFFFGKRRLDAGGVELAVLLIALGAALLLVDAWRLWTLRRLKRLATYGRIDRAGIVAVRRTRLSLAPRADGPAPTGGWPVVRACEVRYAFDPGDGARRTGRFLVGEAEAPQFVVGEDVEIFVDRERPSLHAASLVVRWYYRLSSRHVGLADDDPGLTFDFETPESPDGDA